MKIFLINNFGGGFADHVEIDADSNITQLFGQRMSGCKPQDYLIRVNRQPVPADQVLHEGDRVSITPLKIEGARGKS
jgi:sulfur carrier protein ThiS